jgi:hypothetical protein
LRRTVTSWRFQLRSVRRRTLASNAENSYLERQRHPGARGSGSAMDRA